ncbi:MAG: fumarylacetoacetase [Bacteroidota bacterium]|nr:fumarylacetoacetase [Bacteroidota bacterium]|tara:strand:+ start:2488 stop:3723 length:1236 start_codon:yes stop_codon:yes gene_type:complete
MEAWVDIPKNSDFSIYNIPFGIFSTKNLKKRVGIAIGEMILDLKLSSELGVFDHLNFDFNVFENLYLNDFISLGKSITNDVRSTIQKELSDSSSVLKNNSNVLIKQSDAQMHLPLKIRDYTDFYSSIEHATNIGSMFRDPSNPLLPNWKHIPVGYHGRASSIIVSGINIHRPKGQVLLPNKDAPVFQSSSRVDFELEMGFVIGKKTNLGDSVSTDEAEDYIFGKVLFNDWSARDIQKWEYVPLGPFLGKSFASSISPWIVTIEALDLYKVKGPEQTPKVLSYLEYSDMKNYDINLEVSIQPEGSKESIVCSSNFKYMYWNMVQQLAHHTINGCNINIGDLMASGTISGKEKGSYGSMLELSWGGKNPVTLDDGSSRVFINDNDTVIMRGYCEKDGKRVGFGEVRTKLIGSK